MIKFIKHGIKLNYDDVDLNMFKNWNPNYRKNKLMIGPYTLVWRSSEKTNFMHCKEKCSGNGERVTYWLGAQPCKQCWPSILRHGFTID